MGFPRRTRQSMLCCLCTAFVFFCATLPAQTSLPAQTTWQELKAKADSLLRVAQYDSAMKLADLALEYVEKAYGTEDTTAAKVFGLKGRIFYYQGRHAEAEVFFRRSLAVNENRFGPNSRAAAASLHNVANAALGQGEIGEAEQLYKRALDIAEQEGRQDDPLVAVVLGGLSSLFHEQGRYAEAETLVRREIATLEKREGHDSWAVGLRLNHLARTLYFQGRYAEAEQDYRRALEILEVRTGEQSDQTATVLNNLALLLSDMGRISEAEPLLRRALESMEQRLGLTSSPLIFPLQNLARLAGKQGHFAQAEQLLRRALTIAELNNGPEHPEVARCMLNLSVALYHQETRGSEAEMFCRRALGIWEGIGGSEHPEVSNCLNILGIILFEQGRIEQAEAVYRRAIEVTERSWGAQHPNAARCLSRAAFVYARLGRKDHAQYLAGHAWRISHQNFRDNFSVLSEKSMLDYAENLSCESSRYLTVLLADDAAISGNAVAEVAFSTKGRVTDVVSARQQKIGEGDSAVARLADSLRDVRFALSRLYTDGPGKDSMRVYHGKLDSATQQKERLVKELARRSSQFSKEQELWDVNAAEVATVIPAGSCLVDFVLYARGHGLKVNDYKWHYAVVVLKADSLPHVFELGGSAAIDTAVWHYRQQFRNPRNLDQTAYTAAAESLFSLVWRPFAHLLEGASTVFVAPDGDLNLVSFAGLVDDEGKYLIEDYPIHYLSTGRDLIRLQGETVPGSGLLAMGDPDFDMSYGMSTASAVGLALLTSLNLRSSCDALDKLNVVPLPGTRKEVESVAAHWRSGGASAVTCFGQNATEEEFKRSAPGKRVIHLATHGFYISDECQKQLSTRGGLGMEESGYVGENPLLLSGFLLAGANRHGKGANEAGREDGIVTAEEVAGLNFRGTDLVVLSACETGLGTVKSGEGVYGLRRAFQMAGARTVISALWPIDDKSTAEFMGQLFSAHHETLPQTMQRIALNRISALRSHGKSDHPFFWAGFVATGDWKMR